jgi:hypothetical protein
VLLKIRVLLFVEPDIKGAAELVAKGILPV